jgi:hypothetical protein
MTIIAMITVPPKKQYLVNGPWELLLNTVTMPIALSKSLPRQPLLGSLLLNQAMSLGKQ